MEIQNLIKYSVLPLSLAGVQASAATISYYLDQSNGPGDGINYAQVTISDSGDDILFSVQLLTSAFSVSPDANFGLQNFSFNVNDLLTVGPANISTVDPSTWTISTNTNAGGGFGKFDFQLSGTGSDRTDLLTFSITGVSGDTINDYAIGSDLNPSSGEFFAAHIAGFDGKNSITGAQFAGSTAVVPVPAAVWLFGSGLLGLAGIARRRK